MTYAVATAYSAFDALNLWIGQSVVERGDWRALVEKMNHEYTYRRGVVLSHDGARIEDSAGSYYGVSSNALVYPATADSITIPATSKLWTPDDYDASVIWGCWVLWEVTGPDTGYVRVYNGATSFELSSTAHAAQWDQGTMTLAKLTEGQNLAVYLKVSGVTTTVFCHGMLVAPLAQGTIGV